MALFTRSLWPERVRRPYLRLFVALIAAPLALATALTGVAFLAAGATEPDREATLAVTRYAARVFFLYLPGFAMTFGLAGVALLWQFARRGWLDWLLGGGAAGLLSAAALGLAAGTGANPVQFAVAAALGLVMFLLIRWLAGVRLS